jgi:hypothetical protein
MIAGDGTHVGISVHNLHIMPTDHAVEGPVRELKHRRYDRVFLPYRDDISNINIRQARTHLLLLAKQAVSEETIVSSLPEADQASANADLMQRLPVHSGLQTVIQKFVSHMYILWWRHCT